MKKLNRLWAYPALAIVSGMMLVFMFLYVDSHLDEGVNLVHLVNSLCITLGSSLIILGILGMIVEVRDRRKERI